MKTVLFLEPLALPAFCMLIEHVMMVIPYHRFIPLTRTFEAYKISTTAPQLHSTLDFVAFHCESISENQLFVAKSAMGEGELMALSDALLLGNNDIVKRVA